VLFIVVAGGMLVRGSPCECITLKLTLFVALGMAPDGVAAPVSTNVAVGGVIVAINNSEPPVRPYTLNAVAVGYAAIPAVTSTVTVDVEPVVTCVFAVHGTDSMPSTTTLTR